MFNYNHLYYFYMTAKLGGVMKAAKSLRVAQPSLSVQIKTLEASLNRSLFQKSGRKLVLTAEGEKAFNYCKKIFELAEDFSDYLKYSNTDISLRSKVGVTHEIERLFVADILVSVLKENKKKNIPLLNMISGGHASLVEKLRNKDLDSVITNRPIYGPDILTIAEFPMEVAVVATPFYAKKHNLLKRTSLNHLLKSTDTTSSKVGLILPGEKLKIRIETDLYVQKAKLRNRIVFESDVLATVIRAAADGLGIAFLPLPYIQNELDHRQLIILGDSPMLWHHSLYLISHPRSRKDPTLQELKKHFESLTEKLKH